MSDEAVYLKDQTGFSDDYLESEIDTATDKVFAIATSTGNP